MNHTDRLYAITEELRRATPHGVIAQQLARMLEVSERTVKRDVSALQQAGVPICAQTGVGGGFFLSATNNESTGVLHHVMIDPLEDCYGFSEGLHEGVSGSGREVCF